MEKPPVLKASTPGSHPLIRVVWLAGFVLLLGAVALLAVGSSASRIVRDVSVIAHGFRAGASCNS